MKLKSSIPSNSVKLIDLYNKIISNSLITGPDYQRRLVWKKQHKYAFIETILLNFPFPEIYIASAEVDLAELKTKEVVVDGQQRLTTIVDYIQNKNDFSSQTRVKPFDDLSIDEKREFLNYLITVKDLKDIGENNIIEVFKRINSTNYSLNSNEVLNAEFGGGEFAIFSKLLSDKSYSPSEVETGIIIEKEQRDLINKFFEGNKVFSENDTKRMFDSQYIMLLSSTILEGDYFSRSVQINKYLEKYNDDFSSYKDVLGKILNSISIIEELNLSPNSYFFNKANLFTLLIEFNKLNKSELNLNALELNLLDLENKVDVYYSDNEDEARLLTADETKYFEVSRQGSHELAAREHRGKVIKAIIKKSLISEQPVVVSQEGFIIRNTKELELKTITYTKIIPTSTGLKKGIMDATSKVREFLQSKNIHNYKDQSFGPLNKVIISGNFIKGDLSIVKTDISLYRSNGRGDFRIWFSNLNDFADANDELLIVVKDGELNILNASKFDYSDFINTI